MNLKPQRCALPSGFKASGISAHIKKSSKPDIALLYSERACVASGMFTENKVKAAPVEFCIDALRLSNKARAVVINSGNANCMTGLKGKKDAIATSKLVAKALGIAESEVLVSSTGIIGRLLPMEKIKAAIPALISGLSISSLKNAAEAIMTTDTFPKFVSRKVKIGAKTVTLSGIAKGAGMIAPNMKPFKHATMLAYILTDAAITAQATEKCLKAAVEPTFNAITIDGCMSTNDTVIIMANGAAGNKLIKTSGEDFEIFSSAVKSICLELAKLIVKDAEGATKFIEIEVGGAKNSVEAKHLAMSVAGSNLFKCAMFGSDPNWGRIAAALGSVPSSLDWQKMDIKLNGKPVFKKGRPVVVKDKGLLKGPVVKVKVSLNQGRHSACAYTSDLSYEYVRINAEYN